MNVFLNGTLIDAAEASVSVFDFGFTMGVSVTEQVRTYDRQTPLLDRHLDRFFGGLEIIGLTIPLTRSEIERQIAHLIQTNGRTLLDEDELGIGICATPGVCSRFGQTNAGPTILVYTYPIEQKQWDRQFASGIRLTTVSVQETSAATIPKSLKCRSRMAEQEAQSVDPKSRALLIDACGFITEGTTASVVMVASNQLVAPPESAVLMGVTISVIVELAQSIGIETRRENISIDTLQQSDEVLWLSTPAAILPVTHVNGTQIRNGQPGKVTGDLITAWQSKFGRSHF